MPRQCTVLPHSCDVFLPLISATYNLSVGVWKRRYRCLSAMVEENWINNFYAYIFLVGEPYNLCGHWKCILIFVVLSENEGVCAQEKAVSSDQRHLHKLLEQEKKTGGRRAGAFLSALATEWVILKFVFLWVPLPAWVQSTRPCQLLSRDRSI